MVVVLTAQFREPVSNDQLDGGQATTVSYSAFVQGSKDLRGPGQNICSDCFNKVFDCSIRVYRFLGLAIDKPLRR